MRTGCWRGAVREMDSTWDAEMIILLAWMKLRSDLATAWAVANDSPRPRPGIAGTQHSGVCDNYFLRVRRWAITALISSSVRLSAGFITTLPSAFL